MSNTESRAASAGGITSYIETPNCNPLTVTHEALRYREDRFLEGPNGQALALDRQQTARNSDQPCWPALLFRGTASTASEGSRKTRL